MNRGSSCDDWKNPRGRAATVLSVWILLQCFSSAVWAEESRFSISIIGGIYQPSLNTLNRILGDPHQAILQDPNYLLPHNRLLPAEVRDIVSPKISGNANYGLEAQWDVTDRFSLTATVSLWQGDSTSQDVITTFIRQDLPAVQAPRSARYQVSLTQIWLGWKYNLVRDPERGRIFADVGLAGVSLADLTMDSLFKVNLQDQNFASLSQTEARGLSYTTRLGLGGEYFLTEWLSIGMDINYVIGTITKLEVKRYFQQNFSSVPIPPSQAIQPPTTPIPQGGQVVTTARVQTQNITDTCTPSSPNATTSPFGSCAPGAGNNLQLELNGFQINGVIRFYF